ncbi:MAG: GGDEF domain-containing protein, partial [Prochlorococcaceae cyanobacterium]
MLDRPGDAHFDRIVELASGIFRTPIALISLVDADRQWFLARKGLAVQETPRQIAFCAHTILGPDVLVVPDARADGRFQSNPLVLAEPHIRFYGGAPLTTRSGHNLGTLCVIDRQPRLPSAEQLQQLRLLAQVVMRELELRRQARLCPITGLPHRPAFLAMGEREIQRARQRGEPLALLCIDIDNFRQINSRWGHQAGDGVLLDLCRLGTSFLREQDLAGRLGDEEFALLMMNTDAAAAMALAERLRLAVAAMQGVHSHSDVRLRISGGLTVAEAHDPDFAAVVRRADRALELAKSNGRDQIASLLA